MAEAVSFVLMLAFEFLVSPLRGLSVVNPFSHRFRGGLRCAVPPGLLRLRLRLRHAILPFSSCKGDVAGPLGLK
jgi:hypothetical protein